MTDVTLTKKTYTASEVAFFYRVREAFGGLGNTGGGFPIEVAGIEVSTNEHYYQAMRFPHLPDFQAEILAAPGGIPAKRLAYARLKETRADWFEVNIPVMRHALWLKTATYREEIERLMADVADRPVVEKSMRDDFWGAIPRKDGKLIGANVLGQLWDGVFTELQALPKDGAITVPAPKCGEMTLCGKEIVTTVIEPRSKPAPAQSDFGF